MSDEPKPKRRGPGLRDLWLIVIFLGVYFALQLWVLPKLGVST